MSSRVGIWVGETFAETHALNQKGQVVLNDRWFQSKKTLFDGLKAAIEATKSADGEVFLVSSRGESLVERRRGSTPTVLTTAGFETSLMIEERGPQRPTLRTSRPSSVISADRLFGISESIDASGAVEKPLKTEELEFLKAKLELLKSREIAIRFMHSEKNPVHEKQAAEFFRNLGFKVFTQHEHSRPVQRAYIEHIMHEELDALKKAAAEAFPGWSIRLWSDSGILTEWTTYASALGGKSKALSRSIAKTGSVAFFGLEEFSLFKGNGGAQVLPVQPT
ncbi:MAG TPA: hydantoinase/oxoprolinase N-terminal domain-containing protein, partial [Bdellovibrionales bacterium]|nr:hydantoinase/oxoprolinase N-terminal domain-containing protein [Bdellovibrionales bacterium]